MIVAQSRTTDRDYELLTDGGFSREAADPDCLVPEAEVGPNEVLHLESGEAITVEQMIEELEDLGQ